MPEVESAPKGLRRRRWHFFPGRRLPAGENFYLLCVSVVRSPSRCLAFDHQRGGAEEALGGSGDGDVSDECVRHEEEERGRG